MNTISIGREYCLNPKLLEQQERSPRQIEKIVKLHTKRWCLLDNIGRLNPKVYTRKLEKLEFALQKAWGFVQDRDYHSKWYGTTGCSCSRLNDKFSGHP